MTESSPPGRQALPGVPGIGFEIDSEIADVDLAFPEIAQEIGLPWLSQHHPVGTDGAEESPEGVTLLAQWQRSDIPLDPGRAFEGRHP